MNPFSEKLYSYEEQKNLLYSGGCLTLDVLTVDKLYTLTKFWTMNI